MFLLKLEMPPALLRQASRAKQHLIHGQFEKILEPANKQELSFTGTKGNLLIHV